MLIAVVIAAAGMLCATPAAAARPSASLNVTVVGGGAVRSVDGRIDCGRRCNASYGSGRLATLVARPQPYVSFVGWSGPCVGVAPRCVIAVEEAVTVRALFARKMGSVYATVGGLGAIVSDPPGISCDTRDFAHRDRCASGGFAQGARIRLTATPAAGGRFAGWGGACQAQRGESCDLLVAEGWNDVSAVFGSAEPQPDAGMLTVLGHGGVTSTPAGIDCPPVCGAAFPSGTLVTLTPQGEPGPPRVGWSGACLGISPMCTVAVEGPVDVATRIAQVMSSRDTAISVTVSGSGRVDGRDIRCIAPRRTNCEAFFNKNERVALRAKPTRHSRFRLWASGSCLKPKARVCTVKTSAAKSIVAVFAKRG